MKKLRVLTISHMFPSQQLKQHGIFISRQGQYLAKYGIECDFLVPRPWAPWPLHQLQRWRIYGPANPLSGPKELQAKLVLNGYTTGGISDCFQKAAKFTE